MGEPARQSSRKRDNVYVVKREIKIRMRMRAEGKCRGGQFEKKAVPNEPARIGRQTILGRSKAARAIFLGKEGLVRAKHRPFPRRGA